VEEFEMALIESHHWPPLLAAVATLIVCNVLAWSQGFIVFSTIAAVPVAIGAFCVVNYVLNGEYLPKTTPQE
jgi:hypothetical protein